MNRQVFIAGHALCCARGTTTAEAAQAILAGDTSYSGQVIGERRLPYYRLPLHEKAWLPRAAAAFASIRTQLPAVAASVPLFIASSSFQIGYFEEAGPPFTLPHACGAYAAQFAAWLGNDGPRSIFSNACTSGFAALDAAATLISTGAIDEAVVLGVELGNRSTLAGFAAMDLLSTTACRPFDLDRDGLILGEAVAAVHLKATPDTWRIGAVVNAIDAYSTTGPDPAGGPIASAAVHCLNRAKIEASAIDLVKIQAAGSPGTDLAEAHALRQIFGDSLPALLSLKPYLGHTLGASGIAELSALLACLQSDTLPATPGFTTTDPAIGLTLPSAPVHTRVNAALLNLIGFGGGLGHLVIQRA